MNPFKALKKVVTVPVHEVQDGIRLVKIERAADAVLDALEDAAAHPDLYRSPTWWEHTLIAAQRVVTLIPLPDEGRRQMQNKTMKLAMLAGAVVSVAGAVQHLPGIPPQYQAMAAAVGTIAGVLAGLYHPQPGTADPKTPAGV